MQNFTSLASVVQKLRGVCSQSTPPPEWDVTKAPPGILKLIDLHETKKEFVNFIIQTIEIETILSFTPLTHSILRLLHNIIKTIQIRSLRPSSELQ